MRKKISKIKVNNTVNELLRKHIKAIYDNSGDYMYVSTCNIIKLLKRGISDKSAAILCHLLYRSVSRKIKGQLRGAVCPYKEIMDYCRMSKSTLIRHIEPLLDKGLIKRKCVPFKSKDIRKRNLDTFVYKFNICKSNLIKYIGGIMSKNPEVLDNPFFAEMTTIIDKKMDNEWKKYAETYDLAQNIVNGVQKNVNNLKDNEKVFYSPKYGVVTKSLKAFKRNIDLLRSGNFIKELNFDKDNYGLSDDMIEKLSKPMSDADIIDLFTKAMQNCITSKNDENNEFPMLRDKYAVPSVAAFLYDNHSRNGKPCYVRSWLLYWLAHSPKNTIQARNSKIYNSLPEWFTEEQWSNEFRNFGAYKQMIGVIYDWYYPRRKRIVYRNTREVATLGDFLHNLHEWTMECNQGYLPYPKIGNNKWIAFMDWMWDYGNIRLVKENVV